MRRSSDQFVAAFLGGVFATDAALAFLPTRNTRYGRCRQTTHVKSYAGNGGSRKYGATPKDIAHLASRPPITAERLKAANVTWNAKPKRAREVAR